MNDDLRIGLGVCAETGRPIRCGDTVLPVGSAAGRFLVESLKAEGPEKHLCGHDETGSRDWYADRCILVDPADLAPRDLNQRLYEVGQRLRLYGRRGEEELRVSAVRDGAVFASGSGGRAYELFDYRQHVIVDPPAEVTRAAPAAASPDGEPSYAAFRAAIDKALRASPRGVAYTDTGNGGALYSVELRHPGVKRAPEQVDRARFPARFAVEQGARFVEETIARWSAELGKRECAR